MRKEGKEIVFLLLTAVLNGGLVGFTVDLSTFEGECVFALSSIVLPLLLFGVHGKAAFMLITKSYHYKTDECVEIKSSEAAKPLEENEKTTKKKRRIYESRIHPCKLIQLEEKHHESIPTHFEKRAVLAEERLQNLLKIVSSAVVVAKMDTTKVAPNAKEKHPLIITRCNQALTDTFGYTEEELIGQHISILMPADTRKIHSCYVDGLMRTRRKKIIDCAVGRNVIGKAKDGHMLDLILNITQHTSLDGIIHFTAVFHDVSDLFRQRNTSALLYKSQAELLQSISVPGLQIDSSESIVALNPSVKDMFGFTTRNEMLGRPLSELIPNFSVCALFHHSNSVSEEKFEEANTANCAANDYNNSIDLRRHSSNDSIEDAPCCPFSISSTTASKSECVPTPSHHETSQTLTIRLPHKDNKHIHIIVHATLTCDSSGEHRYLLLLEEVTSDTGDDATNKPMQVIKKTSAKHKTEELEIQRKVLSQFTHELRNKYIPSMNTLELIQSFIDDTNQSADSFRKEMLSIRDEVRTSLVLLQEGDNLVSTRLELHKIWKGAYVSDTNIETVDIYEQMNLRAEAASILGHADVEFRTEFADSKLEGMDVFLRIDMYMFKHIANNLLSNARKACFKGSITLSYLGEKNGSLEFEVADTGRGIPDTIASRLFKEEVASADCRGVGLGLSSCKVFALCVGGNVWLERTKVCTIEDSNESGTAFRFRLPGRLIEVRPSEASLLQQQQQSRSLDDAETSKSTPSSKLPSSHYSKSRKRICHQMQATIHKTQKKSLVPNSTPAVSPEQNQNISDSNTPREDELRVMTFYLVEDSNVIRRSVITKLKAISKRIPNTDWSFVEHPTVESILPDICKFVDNQRSAVVIDENLDSQGGQLRGHELIQALISAGYLGLIISASGDESSAARHSICGAQIIWSKPLPRVARLLETLRLGWSLKSQVDPSVRFIQA